MVCIYEYPGAIHECETWITRGIMYGNVVRREEGKGALICRKGREEEENCQREAGRGKLC